MSSPLQWIDCDKKGCRQQARWVSSNEAGTVHFYQCSQGDRQSVRVKKPERSPAPPPSPAADDKREGASSASGGEPGSTGGDLNLERLRILSNGKVTLCKCCGGNMKVYRRKLNASMCGILCWLVANKGREWAHLREVPRRFVNGGEFGMVTFWGLAEQKKNQDTKKSSSGIWRATAKGVEFARDRLLVASHIFHSSPGKVFLGFEETTTTVREAIGEHFDYQELMRGG